MPAEPEVSIVIPTFNRAGLVARAIDTALQQTLRCEVVVCDHGSSDDTPSVARAYGDRIVYIRREQDHGPFYCWLDGLIHTSAAYVHFTFDDDWIDPSFMEQCLALFRDDCAFVLSAATVHYDDGSKRSLFKGMYQTGVHGVQDIERRLLGMPLAISPGCAVFRKKDVLPAMMIGGLPQQTSIYHGAGNDLLMFLLPLLKYQHFGFIDDELAHFLGHRGSITIDSSSDPTKRAALRSAYREAKYYYLNLKAAQKLRLGERLLAWTSFKRKVLRGRRRSEKGVT